MPLPPLVPTLTIYAGDDFTQTFTFKNPDGTALVLTGTWRATFRPEASSTIATAFTVDSSAQATGSITVTMPATLTSTLNTEKGVWDLEQTANGLVKTWLRGPVTWAQDVSR